MKSLSLVNAGRSWRRALASVALILAFGSAGADGEQVFTPPSPITFGLAMELGNVAQARAWLDAGLPPDYRADRVGTGLMLGAWEGNIALMELFLSRGARIDATNDKGEQALLLAAWKGNLKAVQWLLDHGAPLNRDDLQWTALHYAVFAGHQEIAEYLLQQGAQVNARSPNGSSVLMMAAYEGKPELAKRLMELGADPALANENGHTALDWAMKYDHLQVARAITDTPGFVAAASRPKADWGVARRSEKVPVEIQALLDARRSLEARGQDLYRIDQRIASARARYARQASAGRQPPASTLEISASRASPERQKARLVAGEKGKRNKGNGQP